jgi:hypothetical protein
MAFFVMIFVSGVDIVYPIGNLHIANHFGEGAQALAGGVFTVSTRVGISLYSIPGANTDDYR